MNQDALPTLDQGKIGLAAIPKVLWYSISIGVLGLSAAIAFMIFSSANLEVTTSGVTFKISKAYEKISKAEQELAATESKLKEQSAALAQWEESLKKQDAELRLKVERLMASVSPNQVDREALKEVLRPTMTFTPDKAIRQNLEPNFDQLSQIRNDLSITAQDLSRVQGTLIAP